jgi:hypothetical protein
VAATTPDPGKPAAAVPYAGAGGLETNPEYAGGAPTATATFDEGAAALNKIQPPAAAALPAPAAAAPAPAAVAPSPASVVAAPPAPAAAPAPVARAAPPPAPRAAAPPPLTPAQVAAQAKPPAPPPVTGVAAAHKMLDTKVYDLVKANAPERLGEIPGFVGNKTLREATQMPFVGGQIINGIAPHLDKAGISMKDFQRALTEPPQRFGKQGMLDEQYRPMGGGRFPETAPSTFKPSQYKDFRQEPLTDRRDAPGSGRRELAVKLGMEGERSKGADPYYWSEQDVRDRANQETPLARDLGLEDIKRGEEIRNAAILAEAQKDIPPLPEGPVEPPSPEELQFMSKPPEPTPAPTVATSGRASLEPAKAPEPVPQPTRASSEPTAATPTSTPQGETRPQITPAMAKAFEDAVKIDNGPLPLLPQPDAQPVLPSSQPGGPGNMLSLAPPGLQLPPAEAIAQTGFAPLSLAPPGSQGGSIAMAGLMPQTGVFSTPLLDAAATQPTMGQGSLAPFPWAETANWGWGGSSGGSGFGGLGSMYGDSFGGGETGIGSMNFTPMTWGG